MISIETLRAVARLSEGSLLMLAEGMAKKHGAEGLAQVFRMLHQDGFPGPLISQDWPLKVEGDGSSRSIKLSSVLLQCLEDPNAPTSLIDDFIKAHGAHGTNAKAAADILLFDAASVHRQDVTETLLTHTDGSMSLARVSGTNPSMLVPPYVECLLHGNAEQAIAILKNQPEHVGREMLGHIAAGRKNPDDAGPRVIHPEADMLIANLTTQTDNVPFGGLPRLLDAFEEHIDSASTAQARCQLLQSYLESKFGNTWCMDHLETILGGPVEGNELLARIQAEPKFFTFSTTTVSPFETLMRTAIEAHCAPILFEYRDAIEKGVNEPDPYSSINSLFTSTKPFDAAHFKAAVGVFLEAGHPVDIDRHGTTLLHRLSLSHCEAQDAQPRRENHTFAKLKILLDAGANPRTLSGVSSVAGNEFDDEDKARWNNVVKSHAARTVAHDILDELADKPAISP